MLPAVIILALLALAVLHFWWRAKLQQERARWQTETLRRAERELATAADTHARQEALLESLGLLVEPLEADGDEILRLMYRDKKVAAGKLRFILPDRIGHVELVSDVPEADVLASLAV